jgi:hypothetical protein
LIEVMMMLLAMMMMMMILVAMSMVKTMMMRARHQTRHYPQAKPLSQREQPACPAVRTA